MKVKLDENLPREIVVDLQAAGHEADTVVDERLSGISDKQLMERVRDDHMALFTLDKGIADIRVYPPEDYAGIVLFRPPTEGRGEVHRFVRRHLSEILKQSLSGRLAIVSERHIRIR
jgi:predicted nuclease of predicted toxin-antitoxin system